MKYLATIGLLLLAAFIYTPLVLLLMNVFWWIVSGSILFDIIPLQFFVGCIWTGLGSCVVSDVGNHLGP